MDIETDSGLSIHYEYNDKNYHVIDASVENTGAQTIIHSANYIARSLDIRIKLLTTPLNRYFEVRKGSTILFLGCISYFYYLCHVRLDYQLMTYMGINDLFFWAAFTTLLAWLLKKAYNAMVGRWQ